MNSINTRKEYDQRRDEILNAAENLFSVKGYDKCTINNILDMVGIAKGTFYYYFKSKEEVLDAIVDRVTETIVLRAEKIASNQELSPDEKLINTILALRVEQEIDDEFTQRLHKPENALIHQKSLTSMVTRVTPILNKVVAEGINHRIFKSEFPIQYMQIFLTSTITLLDDGIFQISLEEQKMTIKALVALLEKMLGVSEGDLWNMVSQYYR